MKMLADHLTETTERLERLAFYLDSESDEAEGISEIVQDLYWVINSMEIEQYNTKVSAKKLIEDSTSPEYERGIYDVLAETVFSTPDPDDRVIPLKERSEQLRKEFILFDPRSHD